VASFSATRTRQGDSIRGFVLRLRLFLLLYFFACIVFLVVRTAHWKQVNDPAQLHYACFLMDHGMAPYRDLLEINMPGIYLVNWSVMHTLGGGSIAWRTFDFALMAIAAWAMIAIARPYDWLAGFFGATLFILFHGRDGAGQQAQRDFIIAVLLLCSYAFLFNAFRNRRQWPMFVFGLCAGAAATIKPTPLPFALLLLLLAAIHLKRLGEPLLKPTCYALLGLSIPFAIVFIFLASKQSLGAFWYLLRVELPYYQALGRLSFFTLMDLIATASLKTIAFLALAIALVKRDWWNWEGKLLATGILFGIFSYVGQAKGFPYHRYPMLAFLFLWVGLQMIPALRERGWVRALAFAGVGYVVIVAPLYVREASRKVWDPAYIDSLTADLNRLGGAQLSGHVQCVTMPADCSDTLYRMRLVQATGLFYDYFIFGPSHQPVIGDLRKRFWEQFQSDPPQVVVLGAGLFPFERGYGKLATWPLFQQELATNYILYADRDFPPGESGQRAYRVYVRKPASIGSLTINQYDSAPTQVNKQQINNAMLKEWVWSSSHPVMIGANEAQTKLPKF
jgi:hypothetical protein